MPKEPQFYYAVRVGRKPGIYNTWDECHEQVYRYNRAVFKKMRTLAAATEWISAGAVSGPVEQSGTPYPTRSKIEPADSLPSHNQSSTSKASSSSPAAAADLDFKSLLLAGRSGISSSATPTGSSSSMALEDVVYTDGACSRNGQAGSVAGIGVWWGPNDSRNLSERCPGSPQTNNRAELIAIIRALETAPITPIPLVIKTDSDYAMKCVDRWLPHWRKTKFLTSQGTPVKNADLVMYADALITMRREAGQRVRFQHVRGHAGEPGNEGADALAVHGCRLGKVDARDWGKLRLQLKNWKAPVAEPVDPSMFADMVLDDDQLKAELDES